jgi:Tol biopolymer transport system component
MRWVLACVISIPLFTGCTKHNAKACCTTVAECQDFGYGDTIEPCTGDNVCDQGMCVARQCSTSAECPTATPSCVDGLCELAPDAGASRIDYIAFVSNRDGNNEIYRMRTDGSEQVNLSQHPGNDSSPIWDPTGEHIAFLSNRAGGSPHLYVMRPDGSELIDASQGQAASPCWSPDGLLLAFASDRVGGTNIFSVKATGTTLTQLTTTGTTSSPTWSNDGTRIAFLDALGSVWVMDATGVGTHDLMLAGQNPKWSPVAAKIALIARNFAIGGYDIVLVNSDGSNSVLATMTANVDESAQQWSPDGNWIAGQTNQNEIFVVNTGTQSYANLTMSTSIDDSPSWSPDSTHVLFTSDRGGHPNVYVVPVAGGTATDLTNSSASDTGAVWRPR